VDRGSFGHIAVGVGLGVGREAGVVATGT
jgi:hypothetical protein